MLLTSPVPANGMGNHVNAIVRPAFGNLLDVVPRAIAVRREPCQYGAMCRNIRVLNNFEPPATSDEIHAAALQYVRKVSGSTKPSAANEAVWNEAVEQVAHITAHLLESLVTNAPKRNREIEAAKAKARSAKRYGEQAAS
jgi:hypothetical protein